MTRRRCSAGLRAMAESERTPFGALLRQYRRAASLSQEALAVRAGLSAKGIALLESGRRVAPRPETVTLLATALDLAPAERAAMIAAVTQARSTGAPRRYPAGSASLPPPPSPLIGRERTRAPVAERLRRPEVCLL